MSDSRSTLLIGVDGGGTGCRAAIGTAQAGVLGRAEGGRANAATDFDLALKNVLKTVEAAADNAGITRADLRHAVAHAGLAGIHDQSEGRRFAAALPYSNVVVSDDRATAVTGALGGRDGYLLSIGTGTIAATSQSGAFKYVSGWGFQISDQASGAWLGRATLEQVLLCHDGLADHTPLTQEVFARFDNTPEALVAFSMCAKPGDFATFAPAILKAARSNDPFARNLIAKGADFLSRCLVQLGFEAGNALCLSGGIGPHYAEFLSEDIMSGHRALAGSALDGAFQLAQTILAPHSEHSS